MSGIKVSSVEDPNCIIVCNRQAFEELNKASLVVDLKCISSWKLPRNPKKRTFNSGLDDIVPNNSAL